MKKNDMPVNILINNTSQELMAKIVELQGKFELPSYIMELIINKCLLEVKNYSMNELQNAYENYFNKEEEIKDGQ